MLVAGLAVSGSWGLISLGCGGAHFDGRVYQGEGFAFKIPTPGANWRQIEHTHGALAFRDDVDHATILFNGRCGIDSEDVPLVALTNHLFLQFTEREIREQKVVPFAGREALHTVMTAKLDGVPMVYDAWVLKKDGCVYDLLYVAQPGSHARSLKSFHELIQGFSTVPSN